MVVAHARTGQRVIKEGHNAEDHLAYFRPGEVVFLLKPPDDDAAPPRFRDAGFRELITSLAETYNQEYAGWLKQKEFPIKPITFNRGRLKMVLEGFTSPHWREHTMEHHGPDPVAMREVTEFVRDTNDLIDKRGILEPENQRPPGAPEAKYFEIGPYRLYAASPNWVASATDCSFGGGGCPDKPPTGAPASRNWDKDARDAFIRAVIGSPPGGKEGEGVTVSVFDTWPGDWPLVDPSALPTARLQELATDAASGGVASYKGSYLRPDQHAKTAAIGCDGEVDPLTPFRMDDHGVFAVDIVDNLAQNAEIWVYRVLDEYGAGDLMSVARAVQDALTAKDDRPMILNFSLGFGPPPAVLTMLLEDPLDAFNALQDKNNPNKWLKKSDKKLKDAHTNPAIERDAVDDKTMMAMRRFFFFKEVLNANGRPDVFAVAAAGNDSCRPTRANAPRFPAVVEGVAGVGSVDANRNPSDFSNKDDLRPPDDGVAAFGEDVTGPYSLPDFPDGTPNNYGWAIWSGTSFAAPVASALAACIRSENHGAADINVLMRALTEGGTGGAIPDLGIGQI